MRRQVGPFVWLVIFLFSSISVEQKNLFECMCTSTNIYRSTQYALYDYKNENKLNIISEFSFTPFQIMRNVTDLLFLNLINTLFEWLLSGISVFKCIVRILRRSFGSRGKFVDEQVNLGSFAVKWSNFECDQKDKKYVNFNWTEGSTHQRMSFVGLMQIF